MYVSTIRVVATRKNFQNATIASKDKNNGRMDSE